MTKTLYMKFINIDPKFGVLVFVIIFSIITIRNLSVLFKAKKPFTQKIYVDFILICISIFLLIYLLITYVI